MRKVYQERKNKGEFHLLIKDMMLYDHFLFFQFFRMNPTQYDNFDYREDFFSIILICPRLTFFNFSFLLLLCTFTFLLVLVKQLSQNKEISLANQYCSYVFRTEQPEKVELGSTFFGTEQNRKFSDHVM